MLVGVLSIGSDRWSTSLVAFDASLFQLLLARIAELQCLGSEAHNEGGSAILSESVIPLCFPRGNPPEHLEKRSRKSGSSTRNLKHPEDHKYRQVSGPLPFFITAQLLISTQLLHQLPPQPFQTTSIVVNKLSSLL
jgi:hypothetical protein